MTIGQVIANGPNRFSRVIGTGTMNGISVRVRLRVSGFSQAFAEFTEDGANWMPLSGNYPIGSSFARCVNTLPYLAQVELNQEIYEEAL